MRGGVRSISPWGSTTRENFSFIVSRGYANFTARILRSITSVRAILIEIELSLLTAIIIRVIIVTRFVSMQRDDK